MLTAHQSRLLEYLRSKQAEGDGVMPSFSEMAAHLGLKSKSGIHRLISALEDRGAIRRMPNRARAIEVVAPAVQTSRQATRQASPGGTRIPLLGRVIDGGPLAPSRGGGVSVPDGFLGPGEHYALEVGGDAMRGAGILPGDVAVIRKGAGAEAGAIVAALTPGGTSLRRLRRQGDAIALVADAPGIPPVVLPAARVTVQGRLVALLRSYVAVP